jgi:peptidoglycan-associated lipoprotein
MRREILFPLILASAACAHKQETKTETPPAAPAKSSDDASAKTEGTDASRSCTQDADCKDGELCSQNKCVAIDPSMAECGLARVHFGFNDSEIKSDDKAVIERGARCLRRDHKMHVLIEGNADERGTEEYNLALGDRRATAVEKYLRGLGVSDAQLKTVSYGKEKPLCTEHDENCWSQNRRAETKPLDRASR